MTPGQRAYEAYRRFPGPTMMPLTAERFEWESLQPDDQAAWEAAVRAGAEVTFPLICAALATANAHQARYRKALEAIRDGDNGNVADSRSLAIARTALEPQP